MAEEPLAEATALFLHNEFGHDDVNKFAALAAAGDPVDSLDNATAGRRRSSARYSEVMAPLALGDELRAALVTGGRCWGVLCLHRTDSPRGFSNNEIALVRRLAPHLAEGLRRAVVALALTTPGSVTRGPGVIVLDEEMVISTANAEAERWLAELRDPNWMDLGGGPLPAAIYAAAAQVTGVGLVSSPAVPATRVRTNSGQWRRDSVARQRSCSSPPGRSNWLRCTSTPTA
jgi:hypothetical protein